MTDEARVVESPAPEASASVLLALGARAGEPLARHTSLKVGGVPDLFLEVRTSDAALSGLEAAVCAGWPVLVMGGGSNLLPSDEGVEGLVIKYAGAAHVLRADGDRAVCTAAAGCSLAGLARRLAQEGWAGLEWAVNVPGTVGGAAVNNAGAFGSCTAEWVTSVQIANAQGQIRRLAQPDLEYGYRTSRLKQRAFGPVVVLSADFNLHREDPARLKQVVELNQRQRTRTQPRQLSAGSVFANPKGDFAGRLIEQAGMKGTRVGNAEISARHANFIVNPGRARARDVYDLMRLVQHAVLERFSIWLRPEIELIGRWTPEELAALASPDATAPAPGDFQA